MNYKEIASICIKNNKSVDYLRYILDQPNFLLLGMIKKDLYENKEEKEYINNIEPFISNEKDEMIFFIFSEEDALNDFVENSITKEKDMFYMPLSFPIESLYDYLIYLKTNNINSIMLNYGEFGFNISTQEFINLYNFIVYQEEFEDLEFNDFTTMLLGELDNKELIKEKLQFLKDKYKNIKSLYSCLSIIQNPENTNKFIIFALDLENEDDLSSIYKDIVFTMKSKFKQQLKDENIRILCFKNTRVIEENMLEKSKLF